MNPRVPRSRVTHDRWLISYADFITLLFGLFVVLFAFAKADQKKQMQVSSAIDRAFHSLSVLPGTTAAPGDIAPADSSTGQPLNTVMTENLVTAGKVTDDLEHVRRELEKALSGQIAAHAISIRMDREGLVVSLREAGFFPSGSATPRSETANTIRQIAASLGHTPYNVRVEGHTDNVPMHTAEFDSNWELSSARATRIARMFLSLGTISPCQLSAAGYAEFHPVASNATAEGRAENRRVDLVVFPRVQITFAESQSPQTSGGWRKITDK